MDAALRDAVTGVGRGLDVHVVAQLREFLGERLHRDYHSVDDGPIALSEDGDLHGWACAAGPSREPAQAQQQVSIEPSPKSTLPDRPG